MVLFRVSERWILRSRRSTDREYVLTGTVSTCRIQVDINTLAVSLVSKTNVDYNKSREVKYNLSDLPLGEVIY